VLHQDYNMLTSKPSKYEGVAIVHQKAFDLRPFKEDQWTLNYIFGKLEGTIILAVYLNP
jgi:hypothetical protein